MNAAELHATLPAEVVGFVDHVSARHGNWLKGAQAVRECCVLDDREDPGAQLAIATAKLCCTPETNAAIQTKIDTRKDVERRAGVLGLHANYVWNTDTPTLLARVEALEADRS